MTNPTPAQNRRFNNQVCMLVVAGLLIFASYRTTGATAMIAVVIGLVVAVTLCVSVWGDIFRDRKANRR